MQWGMGTINAADPLIVVMSTYRFKLECYQQNDIETVDIFKSSATAIYGSRGANGVVMITTKKETWRWTSFCCQLWNTATQVCQKYWSHNCFYA